MTSKDKPDLILNANSLQAIVRKLVKEKDNLTHILSYASPSEKFFWALTEEVGDYPRGQDPHVWKAFKDIRDLFDAHVITFQFSFSFNESNEAFCDFQHAREYRSRGDRIELGSLSFSLSVLTFILLLSLSDRKARWLTTKKPSKLLTGVLKRFSRILHV